MSPVNKLIRMPRELADKIQEYADKDNRSFTKQVIQILETYIRARETHPLYYGSGTKDDNSDDGLLRRDRH